MNFAEITKKVTACMLPVPGPAPNTSVEKNMKHHGVDIGFFRFFIPLDFVTFIFAKLQSWQGLFEHAFC